MAFNSLCSRTSDPPALSHPSSTQNMCHHTHDFKNHQFCVGYGGSWTWSQDLRGWGRKGTPRLHRKFQSYRKRLCLKNKWKQTPPFLMVAQMGSTLLVSPSMTYITSSMYRSPRTNSCLDYFSWTWGDFIEIINYSLGLVQMSGERLFRVRRQNPTLRSCSQCHPEHASWKSCEVRRCRQGSHHIHLSFPHALHHHL